VFAGIDLLFSFLNYFIHFNLHNLQQ